MVDFNALADPEKYGYRDGVYIRELDTTRPSELEEALEGLARAEATVVFYKRRVAELQQKGE
jgi:hypothetical protein